MGALNSHCPGIPGTSYIINERKYFRTDTGSQLLRRGCRAAPGFVFFAVDVVFHDFVLDDAFCGAELPRGRGLIAARVFDGVLDEVALVSGDHFFERAAFDALEVASFEL